MVVNVYDTDLLIPYLPSQISSREGISWNSTSMIIGMENFNSLTRHHGQCLMGNHSTFSLFNHTGDLSARLDLLDVSSVNESAKIVRWAVSASRKM